MGAIFGFLTGGPIGALLGVAKDFMGPLADVFKKIEDTRVQLAQATNESEKNRLVAQIEALQVQASVLQTQANLQAEEAHGTRLNVMIRSWMAGAVAFLIMKILVYDKALGQWTNGTTDALDDHLWYLIMVIVGFYFIHETVGLFKR
jgi:hypothetical protein